MLTILKIPEWCDEFVQSIISRIATNVATFDVEYDFNTFNLKSFKKIISPTSRQRISVKKVRDKVVQTEEITPEAQPYPRAGSSVSSVPGFSRLGPAKLSRSVRPKNDR